MPGVCTIPNSVADRRSTGADGPIRDRGTTVIFQRLAVYYLPPPGALARFGADWLGWDARAGMAPVGRDRGAGHAALTATPRRYGFHATLKAPFRLAGGATQAEALAGAQAEALAGLRGLCAGLAPVVLPQGLALRAEHGFLALMPPQPVAALDALAAEIVRGMDRFRAPLTAPERARRHPETLNPRQREQLDRWGYPWIFDDFRFHMTLTGPLADPAPVMRALAPLLPPDLGAPLTIRQVALMGEDGEGRFHLIAEAPLAGQK